jgi:NAD(P)-dependent dehydrogenase (short-subunit alcohol dehydrogenase family)
MNISDLLSVEGKVAVVTGASSGLGVAFAEALAEGGADVEVAARRIERLEDVAGRLKRLGVRARPFRCDITKDADVRALIDDVTSNFGRLDIFVNNAGIATEASSAATTLEQWNRVIAVNLTGSFLCSRAAAAQMITQGDGGKIVNIASIYGLGADISREPPYYAAKAGLINLTRFHAVEWAPHRICVNAIAPGFFITEMNAESMKEPKHRERIIKKTPMARLGEPDDLKGALIFLASRASDFMTGQTIVVDGGWTIW